MIAFPLRPIAASLILATGLTCTVGCYGSFPATSAVYKFNGKITDNGIIHSIVMIVFVIIPVYGVCMLVDGILLNSIEFWSGDKIETTKVETLSDGTEVTLAPGSNDDEAILTVVRDGETILRRTYVRIDEFDTHILDEQNNVVGIAHREANGTITMLDAKGIEIGNIDKSQLLAMAGG